MVAYVGCSESEFSISISFLLNIFWDLAVLCDLTKSQNYIEYMNVIFLVINMVGGGGGREGGKRRRGGGGEEGRRGAWGQEPGSKEGEKSTLYISEVVDQF